MNRLFRIDFVKGLVLVTLLGIFCFDATAGVKGFLSEECELELEMEVVESEIDDNAFKLFTLKLPAPPERFRMICPVCSNGCHKIQDVSENAPMLALHGIPIYLLNHQFLTHLG